MDGLPFIEISVVQTTEKSLSTKQILEKVRRKFEDQTEVMCSWMGSADKPTLLVRFPSTEIFDRNYKRDLSVYDTLLRDINNGVFDPKQILQKNSPESPVDSEIYLILRYRTNRKESMRKNYAFTTQFAQLMNVLVTYEEIEDGFLHFFKNQEDFFDAQFDKTKPENIIFWFQKRGVDPNHPVLREFQKYLNRTAKPTPVDPTESL